MGGVKLLARRSPASTAKDLKTLADDAKKQIGSGVVVFIGVAEDGKAGTSSASRMI